VKRWKDDCGWELRGWGASLERLQAFYNPNPKDQNLLINPDLKIVKIYISKFPIRFAPGALWTHFYCEVTSQVDPYPFRDFSQKMITSPAFRAAARSQNYRKLTQIAKLASAASSNRAFTQPSTATKASVVDIPQSRLQNAEPIAGSYLLPWYVQIAYFCSEPTGSIYAKQHPAPVSALNPIYLDAQVSFMNQSKQIGYSSRVLGYYSDGSEGPRCNAPIPDGSIRKPTQQNACLWMGSWKSCRW